MITKLNSKHFHETSQNNSEGNKITVYKTDLMTYKSCKKKVKDDRKI